MSEKITLQKIFDLAWEHFIVGDGKPALSPDGRTCCYLDADGNRCAVGLALPDGHDCLRFEQGFFALIRTYSDLFDDSLSKQSRINLFQSRLHDSLVDYSTRGWKFSKDEMKRRYISIAEDYNLTVPSH